MKRCPVSFRAVQDGGARTHELYDICQRRVKSAGKRER
jgi:hypothetical protein